MSKTPESRSLRKIPSVESLMSRSLFEAMADEFGRDLVLAETRGFLADLRRSSKESSLDEELSRIEDAVRRRIEERIAPSLRPVVNATGILVHTNLGRAPLGEKAVEALVAIARGYSNLELDLETGRRGSRHRHAERLLAQLFPGRSAMVANNAAAGVMLALNTFARGKEVVISRGELVEIGGSFRVPEILERSGARLREVGTTNKTRVSDYVSAIGPETGAILRVHPSNFRLVGFTESASSEELVALGRSRGLPVIEDLGSGNLASLAPYGAPEEPTVAESLAAGVDLCIFSGDKLLGGPQAGILVGEASRVEACRRNPMARALRVDKLVYAALEATLASHLKGRAFEEIPVLRMVALSKDSIRERCLGIRDRSSGLPRLSIEVQESPSRIGGGAAPDAEIASFVLSITVHGLSAEDVLVRLRRHRPPIVARISEDRVLCDLRTVAPGEDAVLEEALRALSASPGPRE